MSNVHPATLPHVRRAIARRQRRAAFARVLLFGSSCAVCFLSMFPVWSIARQHSGERSGAIAGYGLLGLTVIANASLICAARAANEASEA